MFYDCRLVLTAYYQLLMQLWPIVEARKQYTRHISPSRFQVSNSPAFKFWTKGTVIKKILRIQGSLVFIMLSLKAVGIWYWCERAMFKILITFCIIIVTYGPWNGGKCECIYRVGVLGKEFYSSNAYSWVKMNNNRNNITYLLTQMGIKKNI